MVRLRSVVMAAVLVRLGAANFAAADPADPAANLTAANPPPAPSPESPTDSGKSIPVVPHGGNAVVQTESLGGDAASTFVLDVKNTSGDKLAVVATVLGVAAVDKADNPVISRMVPMPGPSPLAAAAMPGAVTVAAFSTTAIEVPLPGIDGPGIYQIELELVDPNHRFAPVPVTRTIYRRRSWLWAALWIAFGAVVAFGARLYIDGGAARLKLRRRIALLARQVQAVRERAKADAVIAAAGALELDVDDRRRYARWGGSVEDVKCAIDRAELRLALLGDVVDAEAQLERLDPAGQPDIRRKLDEALALVRVDPGDEAVLKTKRGDISQLGLVAAWRGQLFADLALFDGQIAIRLPAALPAFAATLRALAGELALARDDLACDRLDAASARLDDVRPKLLAASADQLALLITGPMPGADASTWQSATDAITAALGDARDATKPWSARWAAFKIAQDSYITTAVTGLIALAKQLAASDAEHAARMAQIADELATALKDPAAAAALYDARRHEIELATKPILRGVAAAAPMAMKMWLPLSLGSSTARPELQMARDVKMLDREVTWTSWMVNGAILAIAVASGVKALWLDDLAWGAQGAALTAFLWGAGVQAVGNAFAGLAALRSRLGAAA